LGPDVKLSSATEVVNVDNRTQSSVIFWKFQALQPKVRAQRVRHAVALPMALQDKTRRDGLEGEKLDRADVWFTSLS